MPFRETSVNFSVLAPIKPLSSCHDLKAVCRESLCLYSQVALFKPFFLRGFCDGFRYANVSLAHFALTEMGSLASTRTHCTIRKRQFPS